MKERLEIFNELINQFSPGRLVDLGTGHGAFARHAAQLGWEVTGVDARSRRFPLTSDVVWVQQDVREHDLSPYNVVACLGLFYHLEVPDQLDLLTRCNRKPLILDTHIGNGMHRHKVSDEEEVDGYTGRWYSEFSSPDSAWGNSRSFWPTLKSFERMLRSSGYQTITAYEPWYLADRTFFLALP